MLLLVIFLMLLVGLLLSMDARGSHPDCPCRICGEVYKGPYADQLAEQCECDHIGGE